MKWQHALGRVEGKSDFFYCVGCPFPLIAAGALLPDMADEPPWTDCVPELCPVAGDVVCAPDCPDGVAILAESSANTGAAMNAAINPAPKITVFIKNSF
jgi:hypothetical protein